MKTEPILKQGPLVQIIEIGLELWIRSQCKSLDKIKLKINASVLKLLLGKISGVRLQASQVDFKNLPLSRVDLTTGPMDINIDLSKQDKRLFLKKAFNIKGSVCIDNEGLYRIISSEEWQWIGKTLAAELLASEKLKKIYIKDNILELQGGSVQEGSSVIKNFEVEASSGTINIKSIDNVSSFLFPMDPAIHINYVVLKEGAIIINGTSTVNP